MGERSIHQFLVILILVFVLGVWQPPDGERDKGIMWVPWVPTLPPLSFTTICGSLPMGSTFKDNGS